MRSGLAALLLGKCRIQVQHEGIGVGSELSYEWHALRHQPGDEGNVTLEAVKLGHHDGAHRRPCRSRPP